MMDTISETASIATRRRRLVIRHTTGDRIVALIEIVSSGNKERRIALEAFVDKAASALDAGYHLMLLDHLPPGPFDPASMHGAVWQHLGGSYAAPWGKPLTLAAYASGQTVAGAITCYAEPVAIGDVLIPMPMFLDPGHYVDVLLESTYMKAHEGLPKRWTQVIENRI